MMLRYSPDAGGTLVWQGIEKTTFSSRDLSGGIVWWGGSAFRMAWRRHRKKLAKQISIFYFKKVISCLRIANASFILALANFTNAFSLSIVIASVADI